MHEILATFPTATDARSARERLLNTVILAENIAMGVEVLGLASETAREGRAMVRIVLIIVLASIVGTAIGVGLGVLLHVLIGPKGTSGLVIQAVSWAIFVHLLIGMLAGYFLLADRTEREIGRARAVTLVIQCANIDADTLRAELRRLGATDIQVREQARAGDY
jgi:hypothetical protein